MNLRMPLGPPVRLARASVDIQSLELQSESKEAKAQNLKNKMFELNMNRSKFEFCLLEIYLI